jgi:ABC-2 type transport system ATP-binding protein
MLQVRRLEKIVDGHSALSIDTLEVGAGEVVAVIGPPRSGKSLLVQLIAGMVPLSGGSLVVDGGAASPVGVLLEEDLLYERLSALENLKFYSHLFGLPEACAAEALGQVGLGDQARVPASRLSPTLNRRLAFARAFLGPQRLLLLDQPILRTDLDTQALFARLIRQRAEEGAAILLTDEDLTWAGRCSTRVIELEEGRILNTYSLEGGERGAQSPERFMPFKVPARKEDRILLYDPGDILYATSRDGRTYLRTAGEEAVTNLTLQELETRLVGRGFFKAHRSYLVNLQHVKSVIQYTRNSYNLQLNDEGQTMIPLSKQFEKELQALLGY